MGQNSIIYLRKQMNKVTININKPKPNKRNNISISHSIIEMLADPAHQIIA